MQRNAITRLTVVRPTTTPRHSGLHFAFPGTLATKSAASARAVAAAICALPPQGAMSCPMSVYGATYVLTFDVAGRPLPRITVRATGCQTVTGAGPVRTAATSPGFWRTVGDAIGLYRAGQGVFGGQGPTVHQCQTRTAGRAALNGCPGVTSPVTGSDPAPVS